MGGRRPTPTALKVVRGTASKAQAAAEPHAPASSSAVQPPTFLELVAKLRKRGAPGRAALARRAWAELLPRVRGMQVLTEADEVALAMLCDALAEYVVAKRTVATEGATFETINRAGGVMIRSHPAVAQAADAWRRSRLMMTEFGLTPAARAKVSAGEPADEDPAEAWMAGRVSG